MSITRRQLLLATLGASILASLTPACSSAKDPAGPAPDSITSLPVTPALFVHGVASGDPLADRVILWTRATPADGETGIELAWIIATDAALKNVLRTGTVTTGPERDFTAKVDVTDLTPGTTYYYAFARADRGRSVTGRTKTLPTGATPRARIAFTSCANYANGFYSAYRAIAQRADLDLWVHLGDYIYEYPQGTYGDEALAQSRALVPAGEVVTLADYRARYGHYRRDPDLQEVHRQHPLVAVWDDHEITNDAWAGGAENHQSATEGGWSDRVLAATQAYLEWLPLRVGDTPLPPVIYRSFAFGDLFDLLMLDTRLIGRDEQAGITTVEQNEKGDPAVLADPARSILGEAQEGWLKEQLTASKGRGAKWRLLGNQVMFSPVTDPRDGKILESDMWDGYQASRQRVADHIVSSRIDNVVFLTGDIHTSWAFDVTLTPADPAAYDPTTGRGAFAVELVGPAVSSQGLEGNALASAAPGLLKENNRHLKLSEVTRKGYVLVDITPEQVQGEWYYVKVYKAPGDASEELGFAFRCASGTPHLVEAPAPTEPRAGAPALAPA